MKDVKKRGDSRKQSKIESVTSVEELESKSWDRDQLSQRFRDVKTTHNNIVRIINDIQAELDSLPSIEERVQEAESEKVYSNMPTDQEGKPKYHPRPIVELAKQRSELKDRESRWMAELMELHRFAERKFKDSALSILEEYRSSKIHGKLEEHLDEAVEDKVEKRITEEKTEIRQVRSDVERVAQAMREQERSLWNALEKFADRDSTGLSFDDIKKAQVEGLEQFVSDDGLGFSVVGEEHEQAKKEGERRDAVKSAAEDVVGQSQQEEESSEDEDGSGRGDDFFRGSDGSWSLKGRSREEKADVLVKMWDEEGFGDRIRNPDDSVTKSEIAEVTDLSQARLFNQGLIEEIVDENDLMLPLP